jgi:glycosyltransferase involved in cell wall biosynthesis
MRIVVHDYSGHPGQVSLSRALAARGHEVVHQYCSSYLTGTGAVEQLPGDPETFHVEAIALDSTFDRYTLTRRVRQEVQFGVLAGRAVRAQRPDVALLSNIPLLSLLITTIMLRRARIPMVFWQQDIYSAAIGSAAVRRIGRAGRVFGGVAAAIERFIARRSNAVVPIDDSFTEVLQGWGIPAAKIHVMPNWAPIAELPVHPKDNPWARAHGFGSLPVVLYTGTLGLKHDPSLLATAARALQGKACVAVVSEGLGRSLLEQGQQTERLDNLELFDFQPYQDLPDVMASADVLVALLEPDASQYSVPSKVLSYLCAGRPIVAVIPPDNSVARIVKQADAGRLVTPGDGDDLVARIEELIADPELRAALGANARRYAEETFDIEKVGARFDAILAGVAR